MKTSHPAKLASLAVDFARHPGNLLPYVRCLPLWGRGPTDVGLPWISFGALRFLEKFIKPHQTVFEYGGGGSTLWFAQRAQSVLTMESDQAWHEILQKKLAARGLKNVSCELHQLSGDRPEQFHNDAFFHRVKTAQWDVVLVDCYCGFGASGYGSTRPFALELALPHVKPGGILVLDDSWMFLELLGPRPGWRITDHISSGPCRYGVTSTAIFERLK